MNDKHITAIDIGSNKIKVVIAELDENKNLIILGKGEAPSSAIKKGDIMEIEKTRKDIESAIEQAEMQTGITVEKVYIGISGAHIESKNDCQHIPIIKKSKEIDIYDIDRVLEAIKALNTQVGREVLHIIPREFGVDDQHGIKEPPLGVKGLRLEVKAHVITGLVISANNIIRAVNRAGLTVQGLVLSPYAATFNIVSQEDKEMGCIFVDIGGDLINIIIFIDGSIWNTKTLSLGSQLITNDIAYTLKISLSNAEFLKIQYGTVLPETIEQDEKILVSTLGNEHKTKEISREFLGEIIRPRFEEILQEIRNAIIKLNIESLVPGGIIFSGGGCKLHGTLELAKKVFAINKEINYLNDINIRLEFPKYHSYKKEEQLGMEWAAPIGIIQYVTQEKNNFQQMDFSNDKNIFKNTVKSFKNTIKDFLNI